MPKYFNLTPEQGKEFIKAIKQRVPSAYLKNDDITSVDWYNFGREMKRKSFNGQKLCNSYQIFYIIENAANNSQNYSHHSKTLISFLEKYFPEIYNGTESKYGILSDESIIDNHENKYKAEQQDNSVAHNAIRPLNWVLFTFGEKETVDFDEENEIKRRRYYIKQRPVKFFSNDKKKEKIIIENSDNPDFPNEKVNKYQGGCHFFTKKKGIRQLYYLETEAMDGVVENQRHLKLLLCFGELIKSKENVKQFSELAIGTFTGIRDKGSLFAGIALLVRESVVIKNKESDSKTNSDLSQIQFHETFINKPVQAAIRILLERKNKAFIKLPKILDEFTLAELKKNLITLRDKEIETFASREIIIHRSNAFISTPFFYNPDATAQSSNKIFLDNIAELLQIKLFDNEANSVIHGLKTDSISTTDIAFEHNFDHIRQSKFFIFILRDIDFKVGRLSTSFIELGFALGIRKKIVIFCTAKMREKLPVGVSRFEDDRRILIIESPQNVNDSTVVESLLNDKNYSKKIKTFLRNPYRIS